MATTEQAKRLKACLVERKMSAYKLAKIMDVTPPAIFSWLSGIRNPSLKNALAIEKELGIPAEGWVK